MILLVRITMSVVAMDPSAPENCVVYPIRNNKHQNFQLYSSTGNITISFSSPSFENFQNQLCIEEDVNGTTTKLQIKEEFEENCTQVKTSENVFGWKQIEFSIEGESTNFSMPALLDGEAYTYVIFNCPEDTPIFQNHTWINFPNASLSDHNHMICVKKNDASNATFDIQVIPKKNSPNLTIHGSELLDTWQTIIAKIYRLERTSHSPQYILLMSVGKFRKVFNVYEKEFSDLGFTIKISRGLSWKIGYCPCSNDTINALLVLSLLYNAYSCMKQKTRKKERFSKQEGDISAPEDMPSLNMQQKPMSNTLLTSIKPWQKKVRASSIQIPSAVHFSATQDQVKILPLLPCSPPPPTPEDMKTSQEIGVLDYPTPLENGTSLESDDDHDYDYIDISMLKLQLQREEREKSKMESIQNVSRHDSTNSLYAELEKQISV
ncbi:hypothetical protein SK128_020764 [Halocaridina rubra]|uniref:Uncharacterized protein n=1 Tax=Halocaridina rubra TaxID=373956 RepID=A0AAN9A296_HALRR